MSSTLDKPAIRKKLLSWYRKNRRDLPWRRTKDPYRILVSEVMLQQTQVDTVIPYYKKFLKVFPTISALSLARERIVLKHWEGLGYYSRAKNLHRAAKDIQKLFNGEVPNTIETLESLPGIGRYTAGAVGSIAFGIPAPIVDGNVKRVLCRLFAIREDPSKTGVKNRLWNIAEDLVPNRAPGDFNQAMMEFGAIICLPRKPSCPHCPLRGNCKAFEQGRQNELPLRTTRRPVPKLQMRVAVLRSNQGFLFAPRPDKGLLGGLWGFPEFDLKKGNKLFLSEIYQTTGLKTGPGIPLDPITHLYSHRRITYFPILFKPLGKKGGVPLNPWKWIPEANFSEFPFPNATKKILSQVLQRESLPLAAEESAQYPA